MTVTVVPDGVRALLADGRVVRIRVLAPSGVSDVLELHQRLSERGRHNVERRVHITRSLFVWSMMCRVTIPPAILVLTCGNVI